MTVSELEQITRDFLSDTLPHQKVLYNQNLPWLNIYNPILRKKTKRELDIYYPDLNFAVEVNGGTHFHPDVQAVDRAKQKLCKKRGVYLFTVSRIKHLRKLRKILLEGLPHLAQDPFNVKLEDHMEYYQKKVEVNMGEKRHIWVARAAKSRREQAAAAQKKRDGGKKIYKEHDKSRRRRDLRMRAERHFERIDMVDEIALA